MGCEVFLTEKGGHLKILVQKAQVIVDLMLGHVSMYTCIHVYVIFSILGRTFRHPRTGKRSQILPGRDISKQIMY